MGRNCIRWEDGYVKQTINEYLYTMKIAEMIRELQKAQEEGIEHVLIKDNKIYQSTGIDNDFKLIAGKKIFPLPQWDTRKVSTSTPTGKIPGDDMGEFAKYSWDSDKGESGMFKYHYDKMREKDWDDPINESVEKIKQNFKRFL